MSSRRFVPAFAPAPEWVKKLARLRPARIAAVVCGAAALGIGGCAQSPQQIAASSQHPKEYFPSSVYGRISPRVVADGQPIPRGGGQYLVGRPYTVAGQTYYPSERRVVQVGNASWYGDAFHGRLTANGEVYDRDGFTAAHPTMPLPSYARVTNLRNSYSMIVRVNDRGPYASDRIMDVSRKVAEALDFKRYGTARIKVEYVGRASLAGSDDAKLFATLRTDGPARWQGGGEPTMVAEERRPARVASLAPYVPAEQAAVVEQAPPRRRAAPVQVRDPWREAVSRPRVERPEAVETAYRRFGVEPAPVPDRSSYQRRDGERDRERIAMARAVEASLREDRPRVRLVARDIVPYPPVRAPHALPRFDRGEPALRPLRLARPVIPPSRPPDVADNDRHRRVVEARAMRYRFD